MKNWEHMNKIISYLGFAIKSKNLIAGQTPCKLTKKTLHLIMVCKTASENLINLAENLANKHKCAVIKTNVMLSDITHLNDIKIIGLTDENLSKAIIENKEKISIG